MNVFEPQVEKKRRRVRGKRNESLTNEDQKAPAEKATANWRMKATGRSPDSNVSPPFGSKEDLRGRMLPL